MSTRQQPGEPSRTDDVPQDAPRTQLIERLFREHNEVLIRFLRSRLRSDQEAREVAQEAYVRVLSLDEPGAVSYLRAFLFRTAENLAVDRLRRDEVHGRATQAPLFNEFTDSLTPERQLAGVQTVERLERVIAALPYKCRQAFILKRFDGLDVAAIASKLNLSERMVREYVARALLRCRASLDLEQTLLQESRDGKDD